MLSSFRFLILLCVYICVHCNVRIWKLRVFPNLPIKRICFLNCWRNMNPLVLRKIFFSPSKCSFFHPATLNTPGVIRSLRVTAWSGVRISAAGGETRASSLEMNRLGNLTMQVTADPRPAKTLLIWVLGPVWSSLGKECGAVTLWHWTTRFTSGLWSWPIHPHSTRSGRREPCGSQTNTPSPSLPRGLAGVVAHTPIPEFLPLCFSEPSWLSLHPPRSICVSEDGLVGETEEGDLEPKWKQANEDQVRRGGDDARENVSASGTSWKRHLVFFFCFLRIIM